MYVDWGAASCWQAIIATHCYAGARHIYHMMSMAKNKLDSQEKQKMKSSAKEEKAPFSPRVK